LTTSIGENAGRRLNTRHPTYN